MDLVEREAVLKIPKFRRPCFRDPKDPLTPALWQSRCTQLRESGWYRVIQRSCSVGAFLFVLNLRRIV